jgi:hypothetical protein
VFSGHRDRSLTCEEIVDEEKFQLRAQINRLFLRACVSKKRKSQSLAQAEQSGGQGHGLPRVPCGAIDGFAPMIFGAFESESSCPSNPSKTSNTCFTSSAIPSLKKANTEREGQDELWDDSPGGKAGTQLKKN